MVGIGSNSYIRINNDMYRRVMDNKVNIAKGVAVGGLFIGSIYAASLLPPPMREVLSTLATMGSVSSVVSVFAKMTTVMQENSDNLVTAMGSQPLASIELKEIASKQRLAMKEVKPIMDNTTQDVFDFIKAKIEKTDKSTWKGQEDNYDCIYLYGPPGTGKTVFANSLFGAVPNEYSLKVANITSGDLMERGAEKLKRLKRNILKEIEDAGKITLDKPIPKPLCIGFFLDEVEASLHKNRSINHGVVSEYLNFINQIKDETVSNKNVYILGALATNFDAFVDGAVKRDGRITHTLEIGYPSLDVKKAILKSSVKDLGININKKTLTDRLTDNQQVNDALSEPSLTGASIEEAMKKTQQRISLGERSQNNVNINEFINEFISQLGKSSQRAKEQREKDEAELQAKQSKGEHLRNIANALQRIAE